MIFFIFASHILLLSVTGDVDIKENGDKSLVEETTFQYKDDPKSEPIGRHGFYCGRHLQAMGYVNTSPNTLYRLYSDIPDKGYFFKDCSVPGCRGVSSWGYCPCEINKKYCGYELITRGFDIATTASHTLYRCRGRNSVSVVEKCSHRCFADETNDSECVFGIYEECEDGLQYCGLEAALMGYEPWSPQTLYKCIDEGGHTHPLKVCENGCIPSTGDDEQSHCNTIGLMAYLPSTGDEYEKDEL